MATNDLCPDKVFKKVKELRAPGNKKTTECIEILNSLLARTKPSSKWHILALVKLGSLGDGRKIIDDIHTLLYESKYLEDKEYFAVILKFMDLLEHHEELAKVGYYLLQLLKNNFVNQKVIDYVQGTKYSDNIFDNYHFLLLMCYDPVVYFKLSPATTEFLHSPDYILRKTLKLDTDYALPILLGDLKKSVQLGTLQQAHLIDIIDTLLLLDESNKKHKLSLTSKDGLYFAKGTILVENQQRNKAKKAFKKISSYNPQFFAEANVELGSYYLVKSEYKKSLKCFQAAHDSDQTKAKINFSFVKDSILSLKEKMGFEQAVELVEENVQEDENQQRGTKRKR